MFPGHFKISGHSGTDVKNRIYLGNNKKTKKQSLFKYGQKFGLGIYTIDEERMKQAVVKKKRRIIVLGLVIFLISIFSSLLVYTFIVVDF